MIESKLDFDLLGGDPFAAEPPRIQSGKQVVLLGSTNAPFGTVVMAGVDDSDDLHFSNTPSGPGSPMTTCQIGLAADEALYGKYGCFGVTQSVDGHEAGKAGPVELGESIVECRVQVPSGGLAIHAPLMVSFDSAGGTEGTLEVADGTNKVIGLSAVKVAAPASAGEALVLIRLRGSIGWGN